MTEVVSVKGLTKRYGKQTTVDNLTFSLQQGRIYGLIGRNGAGKTTLMRMLTAQLESTSGAMAVFGEHPFENDKVLSRICFMKESQKYPDHYKVQDVLDVGAALFPAWDRAYAEELRDAFDLPPKRLVKKLSRGMLSALGIVVGLASRSPLTLFDEPYLGLDAVARELFYSKLLQDYSLHPRTVVLSTHLIDEVAGILEHVLLIDKGRLLLDEEADTLRGSAYSVMGPAAAVAAFLEGRPVLGSEDLGGYVRAAVHEPPDSQARLQAEKRGVELTPLSLQQLLVHLTATKGKQGRKGGAI